MRCGLTRGALRGRGETYMGDFGNLQVGAESRKSWFQSENGQTYRNVQSEMAGLGGVAAK